MAVDIALTDSLDLFPGAGQITGDELIAQRIRLRLQQQRGGWLLDRRAGLPWLDWLTRKPFPEDEALARIRQEVESIDGVRLVESLAATRSGTAITITGRVLTESGVVALEAVSGDSGAGASFSVGAWVVLSGRLA